MFCGMFSQVNKSTVYFVFVVTFCVQSNGLVNSTVGDDVALQDDTENIPIEYAALPRGLAVSALPLEGSDHELMLNVTWESPTGPPVSSYSIEVDSTRDSVECRSTMCYEYNIPGDAQWSLVPSVISPMAGGCAVRPGCSYRVTLIAYPWDGHTSANLNVQLDECIMDVCSCAHASKIPKPIVSASTFSVMGDIFVNVSWSLPQPDEPLRLPSKLKKQFYFISLAKQMVSDAHPSPWYSNTVTRSKEATGFVADPEGPYWMVLPVNERSGRRSDERKNSVVLDVKLLARVSLIDDRGCKGPTGNYTAYDPAASKGVSTITYFLWALLGGVSVMAFCCLLACSARVVKHVLKQFRPAAAASPLQTMTNRPAWFLKQ